MTTAVYPGTFDPMTNNHHLMKAHLPHLRSCGGGRCGKSQEASDAFARNPRGSSRGISRELEERDGAALRRVAQGLRRRLRCRRDYSRREGRE